MASNTKGGDDDTKAPSTLIPEPCRTLPGIRAIAKKQGRDLDAATVAFTLGYAAGEDYKNKGETFSDATATKTDEVVPDKLSPTVQPSHYDLTIWPDLETFRFRGKVDISIDVDDAVDRIRLHSKEISVEGASIAGIGKATSFAYDLKDDVLTIGFDNVVPAGSHVLSIDFRGLHNDQMAGFYRSRYTDADGSKKIMVSTQFESLDARRCFPCWDEPGCKATFKCTLVVKRGLHALSNMPVARRSIEGEKGCLERFEYMVTPRMSTYLLAFCVGKFDCVAGTTKNGVSIACFTPPGRSEQGRFALDVALKTLDLYDDFFGLPYPLPKLDMIAIPEFAAGAMENWGLVTYREVDLLIDGDNATAWQKQRVCTVVTHELAHQWFGNLVTMDWWDDLWLNEGFACWTQTYAANKIFPQWRMWDQFVSDDMCRAQGLDALRSSHPIQVPIRRAEEVEAVFDAISYSKGACVVRMCYELMGEKVFRDGLRIYMQRHKYGNTKTSDLWKAWQEASGMDIPGLMASWTRQMGYPMLTVSNVDPAKGTFDISQNWFLADGSGESDAASPSWNVPMSSITDASSSARENLETLSRDKRKGSFKTSKPFTSWIKLNAGQPTMVRVLYPESMYPALVKAAKDKKLSAVDRVGLVSDAYAFTKCGKLKPSTLMLVLSIAKTETEYAVWETLCGAIRGVDKALQSSADDSVATKFRLWVSGLIAPTAERLGWSAKGKNEPHLDTMLRALIINLLGDVSEGNPKILLEASKRFNALVANMSAGGNGTCAELPSDLKTAVFKMVLRAGGKAEFEQVMKFWRVASTNAEKKFAYGALGSTPEKDLKKRVLEWARDDLKMQDFFYPMRSVQASGSVGADIAWQFLQDNFKVLSEKIGLGSPALLYAVIACCAGGKCTFDRADEVEAFFKRPENAQRVQRCGAKINQMLESMRNMAGFVKVLSALSSYAFE